MATFVWMRGSLFKKSPPMKIYISMLSLFFLITAAQAADASDRDVYLYIDGQDTTGHYDLMIPRPEDRFLDGIRFDFISGVDGTDLSTQYENISGNSLHRINGTFSTENQGTLSFFLKSLVPSIKNIPLKADSVPADLYVPIPSPQHVPLTMHVEMVDFTGTPIGSYQQTAIHTPDLDFQPISTLPLSNYSPTNHQSNSPGTFVPPSDPINFSLGASFNIYAFLSEIGLADIFGKNSTQITIQSIRSAHAALSIGFINENIADKNHAKANFHEGSYSINSTVYAKHNGVQSDVPFGLASFITYTLNDGMESKQITTPGGSLGLATMLDPSNPNDLNKAYGYHGGSVQAITIGADIEGSTCHTNSTGLYTTNASNQNINCARDDLHNSTYIHGQEIIRNLTPSLDTQLTTDDLDHSSPEVLYFKNTHVTIGDASAQDVLINGVKTIVIEDGNLLILDNIKYQNDQSSLGIILINNDQSKTIPDTGNVFIHKLVQQVSAYLYADGGLLSTQVINDSALDVSENDAFTSEEYESIYDRQLIWTGIPNAKKTLGGFIFNNAGADYETPWGNTNTAAVARRYDLHFLRRYSPLGPNGSHNCAQINGACDANSHAMVVRTDNRLMIRTLTPPGFSTDESLSR